MRVTLAIMLVLVLGLVVGCADTSKKPTPGHPTWCTKDPQKVPHSHDCEDIMSAHLPEECKPPEPVVQKPVEPPKPDPIVGTYEVFNMGSFIKGSVNIFRIYANGWAGMNGSAKSYTWERDGELYRFYNQMPYGNKGKLWFVYKHQSAEGEPDLITVPSKQSGFKGFAAEALKVSSDPNHKFDFYKVQCRRKWPGEDKCWAGHEERSPRPGWSCRNVGHRIHDERVYWNGRNKHASGPNYADTLIGCEDICEKVVSYYLGSVGEGNCSEYDSQRFPSDRKP